MENANYVYVLTTNNIGIILDKGTDNAGDWYRTDCDGVREPTELIFLNSKSEVKKCAKQLNAHIAPSTSKLIGIY